MRRLCVFCGANPGVLPAYTDSARALGRALVSHGCGLVYGGGSRGMMGAVADAVLEAGGEAIGIVPAGLFSEGHVHHGLTELKHVETLAERKAWMVQLSDGFVILPGGVGTLDELFDVWASTQLGLQSLPIGLLNVAGYFDSLTVFLGRAVSQGFVRPGHRDLVVVESDPEVLTHRLLARAKARS